MHTWRYKQVTGTEAKEAMRTPRENVKEGVEVC